MSREKRKFIAIWLIVIGLVMAFHGVSAEALHQLKDGTVDDILEATVLRYGAPKSGAEMRL